MTDWEERRECCITFWTKFFSLIVGICMGVSTFLYAIGIFRYMHAVQRFHRDEVAHFLGMGFGVISSAMFLAVHTVPKRMPKESYVLLSVILVISEGLVAHSMGLAAPVVDDCDESHRQSFLNGTIKTVGDIGGGVGGAIGDHDSSGDLTGTLGQSLGNCLDMQLIFAGCFLLLFFQTIAVFDMQRLIILSTRSKTYGDRFAEMGIKGPGVEQPAPDPEAMGGGSG